MEHGVLETLVAARKLIRAKSHWAQESFALDKNGNEVSPNSPLAIKWCMDGALGKVQDCAGGGFGAPWQLLWNVNHSVSGFNDTHTHAEVLAAFDEAIEKLKGASHE